MKLKNIPNLLPEKKDEDVGNGRGCVCGAYGECECGCGVDWNDYSLYNQILTELGEREVELDVEKTEEVIHRCFDNKNLVVQELNKELPNLLKVKDGE